MNRETRSLILGLIAGLALAAAAGFLIYRRQVAQPAQAPQTAQFAVEQSQLPSVVGGAVQLTPAEQEKIGLQTEEVRRESLAEEIVTVGRVEEAETAIGIVSTRYGGRIDKLFVKFAGEPVQKGQPVALLYSTELAAAAAEYKLAVDSRQTSALIEASRRRLQRWEIPDSQIAELLKSPDEVAHVTVYSNVDGIVRERKVIEGQYVNDHDTLLETVSLNTVWVKADVFETDLGRVRPGTAVVITSDSSPGVKLRGAVDFIDPKSDPQTRTTPVRIQVENTDKLLRPGMFVKPTFQVSLGSGTVTVPRNAVIDTGGTRIVYVARGEGIFESRTIEVGPLLREKYPVTRGLSAGDRVVTNGAFLVDSQTRLTGGMTGLFGGAKSFGGPTPPAGASAYKITFRIDPDPPVGASEARAYVKVAGPDGNSVADAQVRLTLIMPAMPSMKMPEMRSGAELRWNGKEYTGSISVSMAGPWNIVVEATRGGVLLGTYRSNTEAR